MNLSLALAGSRSGLAVQRLPSKTLGALAREDPVSEPQVEIQTQGAAFEGLDGVHVQRHRAAPGGG